MPNFICSNCGKRYTEECWYRKHVEKCKLINVIEKKKRNDKCRINENCSIFTRSCKRTKY